MPEFRNAGEAALANIDRLSTAGVAASRRFAHWKDIFADIDRSMALEGEPEAFNGALTRLTAGDLQLMSVKSSPLISRSGDSTATEETCFSIQLVHSGRCQLRHAGAEVVAETGDMVVVDARRPYELTFKRPLDGLVLLLPWARVGHHASTLEKLAGRRMINCGPAAVLSGFIRSAWDHLVEREGEEWPQSASDVIWDLLASVLQDERVAEATRSRADELRRKAKVLVDHQLFDPEFRSSAIAEELGVSARYLQQVFAQAGTTPARFLLARRLDAAAARIRHAEQPRRITDVALECGFSDLSYFSRAFRRRFGVSARGYRLGQDAGAGWL
jgi:AraC-like DNA-binding protein